MRDINTRVLTNAQAGSRNMAVPRWAYLAMALPLLLLLTLPYFHPWSPFMTLNRYTTTKKPIPTPNGADGGGLGQRKGGAEPETTTHANPGLIGMDVEEVAYSIPHGKPYAHSGTVVVGEGIREGGSSGGSTGFRMHGASRGPTRGPERSGSRRGPAAGGLKARPGQDHGIEPSGVERGSFDADGSGGRAAGMGGLDEAVHRNASKSSQQGDAPISEQKDTDGNGEVAKGVVSERPTESGRHALTDSGAKYKETDRRTPADGEAGEAGTGVADEDSSGEKHKKTAKARTKPDGAKDGSGRSTKNKAAGKGEEDQQAQPGRADAKTDSGPQSGESASNAKRGTGSLRGADAGRTKPGGDGESEASTSRNATRWDPVDVACPKPEDHRLYNPFKIRVNMGTDRDEKIRPLGKWAEGVPGINVTAMVEGWPSLDLNVLDMKEMVPQRRCTWETCFDRERLQCRGQSQFGVYEYPIDMITSFGSGRPCLEFGSLGDMSAAGFKMVATPEEACLFLVRPPCLMESSDLWGLPHWNGGRNHVIIYPNVLDRNNPDAPVVTYDTGAAILVHQGHISGIFRPGFDVQIILDHELSFVHQYPSTVAPWTLGTKDGPFKYITSVERKDGNEAGRNITMSFRGNLYEWPILWCKDRWQGAATLNSPANGFIYEYGCVCTEKHTSNNHKPLSASPANSRRYRELLVTSRYIFTPGGGGGYSYRFIEVLTSGAVPVVTDDLVLPLGEVIAWDRCAIAVPRAKIPEIPQILAKISEEERLKRVDECVRAAKMFQNMEVTFDGMWESLGSRLLREWHQVTPEG